MVLGGTIVEEACDPRPVKDPNCIMPLQSRDSVFLLSVLSDITSCSVYVKCGDEMETQEMADQCAQMREWLSEGIQDSFNRAPDDLSRGFFRGRNGSGEVISPQDAWRIHGGITYGGSAHIDERNWDIYRADSAQMRKPLVQMLMHEAVHMYGGYNHGDALNPNYPAYDYFRYLIPGSRHGCVRV